MSGGESFTVLDINKWLHPELSGKDAESLLKKTDVSNGCFLVRHSTSKEGCYTMTVRRGKDDFVHVKIFNSGEYYDVHDGSSSNEFASLIELLFCYWSSPEHQMTEKNGKTVKILHPVLNETGSIPDGWFYGSITAQCAEEILNSRAHECTENTFLLRRKSKSQSQCQSQYVLSVRFSDGRIQHIVINYQGDEYFIDAKEVKNRFDSLSSLVDHYKENPITFKQKEMGDICIKKPLMLMSKGTLTKGHTVGRDAGTGKDKYQLEFNELQKLDIQMQRPRTEGQRPENKERNRYKNILPFDETRVQLRDGNPDVIGSDYINANYISLNGCQIRFIATQGCLAATVPDFWRMVLQERTRIIVMVTELVEMGKNKCTQYWPKTDNPAYHNVYGGRIGVHLIKESGCSDYKIRELSVWRENQQEDGSFQMFGEKQSVFQYHFTAWPDKSLPKKPEILVRFLYDVVKKQTEMKSSGPVVVHCSAGIGRTGTFIVIGFILDEFKRTGKSEVNIKAIVKKVREQRSGMVQTDGQYKFLYAIVPHIVKYTDQGTEVEYANLPTPTSDQPAAVYENVQVQRLKK